MFILNVYLNDIVIYSASCAADQLESLIPASSRYSFLSGPGADPGYFKCETQPHIASSCLIISPVFQLILIK